MMKQIILEDESLRDGLQFEKVVVPLDEKIKLFNHLQQAGVQRIQVGSFVNPKVVPQMADTDEFVRLVRSTPGVLLTALALDEKGLKRAIASKLRHISLSVSASNLHSLKNVRKPLPEAISNITELIKAARTSGLTVRAGVQCAFGCVYEGSISEEKILEILLRFEEAGAREFNLADTAGMASPLQIKQLVSSVQNVLPNANLSLHLHDTRGLGIANMVAGFEAGIRNFDTSVGGLGGCPFVKGAAGNVPTEDAVNLFNEMKASTGINLVKICEVSDMYEQMLEKPLPGHMSRVLNSVASITTTMETEPTNEGGF